VCPIATKFLQHEDNFKQPLSTNFQHPKINHVNSTSNDRFRPELWFLHEPPQSLANRLEESEDAQRRVERALAALPPMQAAVVGCVNCEGMTYEETAARLGISVHTVKKYVVKAHARIRMDAKAWK
jgi:RNA polymerase sigma factor (sigma-70 family)